MLQMMEKLLDKPWDAALLYWATTAFLFACPVIIAAIYVIYGMEIRAWWRDHSRNGAD